MDVGNNRSTKNKKRRPNVCRCEVFLSFRREDVGGSFVPSLYHGLTNSGICTFVDDLKIEMGEEIMPTILGAIRHAQICIPIFTKDFASSPTCLMELAEMVACGRTIIPIFYDVSPSVVREQQESYQRSFCDHEAQEVESATIDEWKEALQRVSTIRGFVLKEFYDGEYRLQQEVVSTVRRLLRKNDLNVIGHLVGIGHHVLDMMKKLGGHCENGRVVGGGIRGLKPPVLTPPPVIVRPVVGNLSPTRDLLNSFGPQEGPGGDEDCPVRPLNTEDRPDGDDEKVSEERTSQSEDDWHSCLSTSVEDEKSDDKDSVGRTLSANISEPVHNVSPNGSFRIRITSWKKGKELGRGAYGTVYEGISNDGFIFAIKEVSLIDPGSRGKERLLRLQQEISLLSQLDHENIVRYLGSDKDDEKLYIFLELMTNGSLVNLYIKDKLRDFQVSEFTRQILNGLKYLHDRKVVHRDIKCANILVDASGSAKLADFGLAKVTEMSAAKTFLGSAFWMAPEVVNPKLRSSQSNRSYGLKADIWSLGGTALEMLTCQHPYPHLEQVPALFRIAMEEPPSIPDSVSGDARDFIRRCLQVNPNDRPSAAQLLDHPFVRKPPSSSGFAKPSLLVRCSEAASIAAYPQGSTSSIS